MAWNSHLEHGLGYSPKSWWVFNINRIKETTLLYINHFDSGEVTFLLVYVDDIIVIGNDEQEQQRLSQCLVREFEIKTLEN